MLVAMTGSNPAAIDTAETGNEEPVDRSEGSRETEQSRRVMVHGTISADQVSACYQI
jgi:hypothetical protein